MKRLSELKKQILAAFPVIGPHADIEAEMMLAGKKPVTWMFVLPDGIDITDAQLITEQQKRKSLDLAVKQGELLAIDVEQYNPKAPEGKMTFRHYAKPEHEDTLKRIAAFNNEAFNGLKHQTELNHDMGHYLGYRKRDVLFFNYVMNSSILPNKWKDKILDMNAPCQKAFQERALQNAGYINADRVQVTPAETTLDIH